MANSVLNSTAALLGAAAEAAARVAGDDVRRCADAIGYMLRSAMQPWAARMLDATVKLPEPLLGGLLTHLGDFDGCLAVTAAIDSGPAARYCLASLRIPIGLMGTQTEAVPIRVGLCVPHACVPGALDQLLRNVTSGRASVSPAACQAADDPRRELAATTVWGVVLVVAVFVAGVSWVLSSRCARCAPSRVRTVAAALSPASAWRALGAPAGHGPLAVLAGIRVVSIAWVVLGHRLMALASLPLLDLKEVPDRLRSWQYFFIPGGLFAVDSFLALAGLVLAFTFMRRPPPCFGPKQFALFYLHRYIRLTPLLAFVVLSYAGALPVLGVGPLWPQQEDAQSSSCRRNWWPTLLYIHNYYNNRDMCVGHAWYLAVDMQLYVLSPLLLLPMTRWPRAGRWLLGAVLAASIAAPAAVVAARDLIPLPNPFGDPTAHVAHTEGVYIPTHARAAPWLLGLAVGAWLSSSPATLHFRGAVALWASSVAALLAVPVATTAILRQGDDSTPSWESAVFVSLSKPLWALGVLGVVVACACGRGGPVASLLRWRPLAPLARLSYGVYLLHPLVQAVTSWPARTPSVDADFVLWPQVISDLVISFAASLLASILFESPFIALERLLLRPPQKDEAGSASMSASTTTVAIAVDTTSNPAVVGTPAFHSEVTLVLDQDKIRELHRSNGVVPVTDAVSIQVGGAA